MSKNGVKLQEMPVSTLPSKKGFLVPVVVGAISLGIIAWCLDHIAGNCLDKTQVFTYCPLDNPPVK